MKHISLDHESASIQSFVRGLPVDPEGSLLEIGGQPLLRVLPIVKTEWDPQKLKDAILRRRDESRASNTEWNEADGEVWNSSG